MFFKSLLKRKRNIFAVSKYLPYVVYFDRVYYIKTRYELVVSKKTKGEILFDYFKLYKKSFKESIASDLDIDVRRVFVNKMRYEDGNKFRVSYEVFIDSNLHQDQIIRNIYKVNFSGIKIVKDFMRNNLGRKYATILGDTQNVHSIIIGK